MPATTPPSLVLNDRVFGATSGVKPPQDNEQAAPPSLPPPPKAPTHAHGGAAGAGAGAGMDDFTFTQDKVDCPNGIDYDRVVDMFGVQLINHELIARVEALTGRSAHLFLKRGLFFAHRDLEPILDAYEKGEPFYLYTGRGPSRGSLHLGASRTWSVRCQPVCPELECKQATSSPSSSLGTSRKRSKSP